MVVWQVNSITSPMLTSPPRRLRPALYPPSWPPPTLSSYANHPSTTSDPPRQTSLPQIIVDLWPNYSLVPITVAVQHGIKNSSMSWWRRRSRVKRRRNASPASCSRRSLRSGRWPRHSANVQGPERWVFTEIQKIYFGVRSLSCIWSVRVSCINML